MEEQAINNSQKLAANSTPLDSTRREIGSARIALSRQLLFEAKSLLERVVQLIGEPDKEQIIDEEIDTTGEQISQVIEGVFDGEKMVGPDGRHYSVPANYASKSKLVEGDLLKLTITETGAFVYKQIGPISRRRIMGTLVKNSLGSEYSAKTDERTYRLLTASVTFFHGKAGDEVTIVVPENGESKWAAVENIIKH